MGEVSLTMIVKVGVEVRSGVIGMKPLLMPVMFGITFEIGTQGFANVDWVTV